MSFNRLSYDKCAYATEVKESVSPLEYNLFQGKYINGSQCAVGDFTNNLPLGSRADVENELLGLARLNTKCPSNKFNPKTPVQKVDFTPPTLCQSIYHITPNNLNNPSK